MKSETRQSPTRLVPMIGALLLLLLWAAESAGWFALLFLLPIALVTLPLAEERLYGWLVVLLLLVAAIVLALPVSHVVWTAYVCVLAPFVPVRHALRNLKQPRSATLLTAVVVTVWTGCVLFGLYLIGVFPPVWLTLIRGIFLSLAFFAFLFLLDAAYQLYLIFYRSRLRRFLLPRA